MVLRKLFLALAFLIGVSIALISHAVRAEVLFEGYSKILSGGVHVGYAIDRHEYDSKKKQFLVTTFLKTGEFGGNLTESLRAASTEDMQPVSYQYTTLIGNQAKMIDAKFEKGKMIATVKTGAKVEKITKEVPKGSFLSSFLVFTMLRSPKGLQVDTRYDYQAIAEEDAALNKGIAVVKNQEDYKGLKVLRVLNEFKGNKFISYISDRGQIFSTKSPAQSIATELVANPGEATAQFQVPTATLKTLFGEIPAGQTNEIAKRAATQPAAPVAPPEPPNKQQGIPGGKGIQIKTAPAQPGPEGK